MDLGWTFVYDEVLSISVTWFTGSVSPSSSTVCVSGKGLWTETEEVLFSKWGGGDLGLYVDSDVVPVLGYLPSTLKSHWKEESLHVSCLPPSRTTRGTFPTSPSS